jgi:MFS family permease
MNLAGQKNESTSTAMASGHSVILLALGGMATLATAMGIGRFVFTPLLPDLMDGLNLSPSEAGLIASANYVGYLFGAILAGYGWAAGREKVAFLSALVATTLLLAAMPLTNTLMGLSAIRFAAGVASAFAMIFCTTILFSHFEAAGRTGLQAVHFGGVGVGLAVSALLLLALDSVVTDWTTGWYAAAALALVGTLFAFALARADPLRDGAHVREPPLVWNRKLTSIFIAYGLFGLGYIVTATFLVAIVREEQGQSSLEGLVWLATGIAAAPSVLFWAPLGRRFGPAVTFSIGCLVEAVGVAASVLLPPPAGPFIGGILLGGTFVAVTAFGLQIGRSLAPKSPRKALAVMTAAFGTGQIIGPLIAGTLAELSGNFTSGSLVAAVALIVSATLALAAKPAAPGTQL